MSTLRQLITADPDRGLELVRDGVEYVLDREMKDGVNARMEGSPVLYNMDLEGWSLKPEPPKDLDAEIEGYKVILDTMVGAKREKFVTSVPGQDMTYLAKHDEAKLFIAALPTSESQLGNVPYDTTPWPFISSEKDTYSEHTSGEDAANSILLKAAQWAVIGSLLERYRLEGKVNISAATTPEEAEAACNAALALVDAIPNP